MRVFTKAKSEATISAKIIKKDGRIIDLGVISYTGPWYKKVLWRISKLLRRR